MHTDEKFVAVLEISKVGRLGERSRAVRLEMNSDIVDRSRIRRKRRNVAIARRKVIKLVMRSTIVILATCLLIAMAGYVNLKSNSQSGASLTYYAQAAEEAQYEYITVRSGDTIWGIAGIYSKPSKDIRILIKEICELNGIKSGSIYPGQVLKVPVI